MGLAEVIKLVSLCWLIYSLCSWLAVGGIDSAERLLWAIAIAIFLIR